MSDDPAQLIYDYLSQNSPLPPHPVDAIIGFGHFDLRIAHHCAKLWRLGAAPHIIFSGGVGAGSADLGIPEAEAFANVLRQEYPDIPASAALLESRSTNTGENVRFLAALATTANCPLDQVVLVATPFRQRRVNLTWQAQGPLGSKSYAAAPPSTLKSDCALFATKGEDLIAQLPGEIDRLQNYANHGWIAPADLPSAVLSAQQTKT